MVNFLMSGYSFSRWILILNLALKLTGELSSNEDRISYFYVFNFRPLFGGIYL